MKIWTLTANVLFLLFVSCSKGGSIPGDHGAISAIKNKTFFDSVGAVKPYNSANRYAQQLQTCVYADSSDRSCSINSLPFIGISKKAITTQDVLDRTMVSHDFLGESFKQVLNRMNPEMLQMFGAVNAIVISDKINPSFYYSNSGAIYLSGRFFWRNAEEFALLNQVRDSREDYGSALQFLFVSEYFKNGKSISERAKNEVQTYDEISLNLARLLFHELTHANDYFPKTVYQNPDLDLSKSFQSVAHDRFIKNELISMKQPIKVSSDTLIHLADILFSGEEATKADSEVLAEEVVKEFRADVASADYSYSTDREDLAMCSEEALMLYYYGFKRYIVVVKLPEANYIIPEDFDYPIVWGEVDRILEPTIKSRALFAIENVLSKNISDQVSKKLDQFSPKEIPANTSWADIYNL
jgi:hypothetical protein